MKQKADKNTLRNVLIVAMIVGITLILSGLYLAIFTDTSTKKGVDGILTIAGLVAGGLFISVPAKLYLTLQLMRLNDEHVRAANELETKNEN